MEKEREKDESLSKSKFFRLLLKDILGTQYLRDNLLKLKNLKLMVVQDFGDSRWNLLPELVNIEALTDRGEYIVEQQQFTDILPLEQLKVEGFAHRRELPDYLNTDELQKMAPVVFNRLMATLKPDERATYHLREGYFLRNAKMS